MARLTLNPPNSPKTVRLTLNPPKYPSILRAPTTSFPDHSPPAISRSPRPRSRSPSESRYRSNSRPRPSTSGKPHAHPASVSFVDSPTKRRKHTRDSSTVLGEENHTLVLTSQTTKPRKSSAKSKSVSFSDSRAEQSFEEAFTKGHGRMRYLEERGREEKEQSQPNILDWLSGVPIQIFEDETAGPVSESGPGGPAECVDWETHHNVGGADGVPFDFNASIPDVEPSTLPQLDISIAPSEGAQHPPLSDLVNEPNPYASDAIGLDFLDNAAASGLESDATIADLHDCPVSEGLEAVEAPSHGPASYQLSNDLGHNLGFDQDSSRDTEWLTTEGMLPMSKSVSELMAEAEAEMSASGGEDVRYGDMVDDGQITSEPWSDLFYSESGLDTKMEM